MLFLSLVFRVILGTAHCHILLCYFLQYAVCVLCTVCTFFAWMEYRVDLGHMWGIKCDIYLTIFISRMIWILHIICIIILHLLFENVSLLKACSMQCTSVPSICLGVCQGRCLNRGLSTSTLHLQRFRRDVLESAVHSLTLRESVRLQKIESLRVAASQWCLREHLPICHVYWQRVSHFGLYTQWYSHLWTVYVCVSPCWGIFISSRYRKKYFKQSEVCNIKCF